MLMFPAKVDRVPPPKYYELNGLGKEFTFHVRLSLSTCFDCVLSSTLSSFLFDFVFVLRTKFRDLSYIPYSHRLSHYMRQHAEIRNT